MRAVLADDPEACTCRGVVPPEVIGGAGGGDTVEGDIGVVDDVDLADHALPDPAAAGVVGRAVDWQREQAQRVGQRRRSNNRARVAAGAAATAYRPRPTRRIRAPALPGSRPCSP